MPEETGARRPNMSARARSEEEARSNSAALYAVVAAESWRVTPSKTGGADDGDEAQRTAAEVESEAVVDGEAAFLAASAAAGNARESPTVFTGSGEDGSAASLRSRFLTERAGGTRIEAAVAWRNSANAPSRILTRVSMVGSVLERTGREQHAA